MARLTAAWSAFKDPESLNRDLTREQRMDLCAVGWSYYRQLQFSLRADTKAYWTYYLASRDLYKHTRLIYNPVPQIVDFYVDNIWQAANNEEVEALVTPVSEKTDEKIITGVAQLDQWSNWLSESQKIKRYAAATGNVLIEGIDDPQRQKVLHKAIWPGYVTEIELNSTGDVLAYTLEYEVYDREKKGNYRYKKIVTQEEIRYFRDDRPFSPDGIKPPVERNLYGFTFAVWLRHTDDGSDYGLPACHSLDKVDNVNSLASHIDDFIHKAIESPKIISADGDVLPIIGATRNADGTLTDQDPRLNWMVLKAKPGASVHDLLGLLDLASVSPELDRQLKSFENDYPELQASTIIRENSQLSGAALERMLGPAQNRLNGVQPNYNQQLVKLRQMQLAVAGMRSNGGGWNTGTIQQAAFKPFNLSSYAAGQLDFNLKPSVLVQTTAMEDEELLKAKADRAAVLFEVVDNREFLNIAGYTEDQIDEITARAEQEPEDDPVEQALLLASGGVRPRQLPASTAAEALNG